MQKYVAFLPTTNWILEAISNVISASRPIAQVRSPYFVTSFPPLPSPDHLDSFISDISFLSCWSVPRPTLPASSHVSLLLMQTVMCQIGELKFHVFRGVRRSFGFVHMFVCLFQFMFVYLCAVHSQNGAQILIIRSKSFISGSWSPLFWRKNPSPLYLFVVTNILVKIYWP